MARLAFLLPDMRGGGAERVALTLIQEFARRGHEIDLVLMQATGELLDLLPPAVRVVDLKAERIRGALWPLIRYMRDRRPAALQARMWPLTAIAILAGRLARTGTRVVVSDHSILSVQYGGSPRTMAALKATVRLLYPLADARICVSEGTAADLSRISGLALDRFTVIQNPAPEPPSPLTSRPEVERRWPTATQRILTVGSLKDAKDHALLLRAFACLEDASLTILGEGPLRSSLEALAEELRLRDRVVFPGFAADPWPYYASANLFVLTSNREGYPNVLIEAMLAGLPVVSTDCPNGPREILDDGRFGRLVPVADAAALSRAMAGALKEPHDPKPAQAHARKLGAEAVARYERLMTKVISR